MTDVADVACTSPSSIVRFLDSLVVAYRDARRTFCTPSRRQ
jgi:hypothetical protein